MTTELAHLKTGNWGAARFHPDGQSLITNSSWGLYRWPIQPAGGRAAGRALRVCQD